MTWSEWKDGFLDAIPLTLGGSLHPDPVVAHEVFGWANVGPIHDEGYSGYQAYPSFGWESWAADAMAVMASLDGAGWNGEWITDSRAPTKHVTGAYASSDGSWGASSTWESFLWGMSAVIDTPGNIPRHPEQWAVSDLPPMGADWGLEWADQGNADARGAKVGGVRYAVADTVTSMAHGFSSPKEAQGRPVQFEGETWEWQGWQVARPAGNAGTTYEEGNDRVEIASQGALFWFGRGANYAGWKDYSTWRGARDATLVAEVTNDWAQGYPLTPRGAGDRQFITTAITQHSRSGVVPLAGWSGVPIMSKSILVREYSSLPDVTTSLAGLDKYGQYSNKFRLYPIVKTPRWRYWDGPGAPDYTEGWPGPGWEDWSNPGFGRPTYREFGPGRYRVMTPLGWHGEGLYDLFTGMADGLHPLKIRLASGEWQTLTYLDPMDIGGGIFNPEDKNSPHYTDPSDPHGKPYE